MKHLTCLVLIFASFMFVSLGCKRSASERQRQPVNVVKDSDFINAPIIKDSAAGLEKKERVVAVVDPNEGPEEKEARQKKEQAKAQKVLEDENQKKMESLIQIGRACREFAKANPHPKLELGALRQFLRRKQLDEERKMVESKRIEVVLNADFDNPKHFLAYRSEFDDTNNHMVVYTDDSIGKVHQNDLPTTLDKQMLQAVYKRFVAYAQQTPQRSVEGFKQYLRENATPALVEVVATQSVWVNPAAALNNPGELVACRNKSDTNLFQAGAVLGHLSVMGNGEVRYLLPDVVQRVFPK